METKQQLMQDNDPCGCDKALLAGVFSYRYLRGDKSSENYVHNFLATATLDEYKSAVSAGGGFSIDGFGFDANMNDDEFKKHQNQFKSEHTDWSSTVDTNLLVEKFGDKNVLDSWTKCKLDCKQIALLDTIRVNDAEAIIFKLKWTDSSGLHSTIKISSSGIDGNGVVAETGRHTLDIWELKSGDANEQIFNIKRLNKDKPVYIKLDTDLGTKSFYIPKYIDPLPEPPKQKVYYEIEFNDINQNGVFDMMGVNGNTLNKQPQPKNIKDKYFSSYLTNGDNSLNAWILGKPVSSINAEITITKYFKIDNISKSKIIKHLPVTGNWKCDLSSSHADYCNAHIEANGSALEVGEINNYTIKFTISSNEEIVNSKDDL